LPHQDKAEGVPRATADKSDMERDASFYVFSFGFAREFTIQKGNGVPKPDKKSQKQLVASDILWQRALASGSLLKVSPEDNREYHHALHKMTGAKERWSLIFRVIKTFIPINPAVAAEVNDSMYAFISKAQMQAGRARPEWPELEKRIRDQKSFTTAPQRREMLHSNRLAQFALSAPKKQLHWGADETHVFEEQEPEDGPTVWPEHGGRKPSWPHGVKDARLRALKAAREQGHLDDPQFNPDEIHPPLWSKSEKSIRDQKSFTTAPQRGQMAAASATTETDTVGATAALQPFETSGIKLIQNGIPVEAATVDSIHERKYFDEGGINGDRKRLQTKSSNREWCRRLEDHMTRVLREHGHMDTSEQYEGEKEVHKMRALLSLETADYVEAATEPQEGDQAPHTDEPTVRLQKMKDVDKPLSVVYSIQDGTRLRIKPLDGEWMIIRLNPGDMLVFRGDVCHNGLGYASENYRVHAYIYPPRYTSASALHPCP